MRGRSAEDYTICPKCIRKTVVLVLKPNGEDNYRCLWRHCDWWTFCSPDDQTGKDELLAYARANQLTSRLTDE